MSEASNRLRREGPSVHHALCDLRRPPAGPLKCTCRVPEVAAAVADLLDALDDALLVTATAEQLAARNAVEAAITRTGGAS